MPEDPTPQGAAPLTTLDVACFKWGTMYQATHVNRLRAMITRHVPADVTFHCITDDPHGLHPDIVVHDLAELPALPWEGGHGRKLSAFSPDFLGLSGHHVLIVDIDVVVIGSLDYVLDRPDRDFVITPGHGQYRGTRGHGALYRLRAGSRPRVWQALVGDPEGALAMAQHQDGLPGHLNEQVWLDHCLPDMDFFPEGMLAYYRQDCGAKGRYLLGGLGRRLGLTTALWGVATPPPGTRVVSFAGRAQPWLVAHHHWGEWRRAPFVDENWHE